MNFLPQKHKSGLRVNYNSGFFITTNVYPDFGNERDNEAIKKRLEVFQTSSLKRKDPTVAGKKSTFDYPEVVFLSSCIGLEWWCG